MEKFVINVDNTILKDLKNRLANTRWPDEIENEDWDYGTNKAYLKKLCSYWRNTYDWKKQESKLNELHHFKADIEDYKLHFLYEKGEGEIKIPLLLTHGWPDSFFRFVKLLPLLTKADSKRFSFDVIIPSIPGHGFSEIPTEAGMNNEKIADIFNRLMTDELGYEKYFAHGGDAGSEITEQLALYHSDHVLAIHLTDIPYHHIIVAKDDKLTSEEKKYKQKVTQWQQTEGAYNMIQSTKPQSLAYALNDSPAGLAGWIIEKFYKWSDCDGNLENTFTKDELLTNIMIYWVTQTINSSFRRYNETMKDMMQEMFNPLQKINPFNKTGSKTNVPTAVAEFTTDLLPPKDFANQFFNIEQWNKMSRGGHFAALEQPDLLAKDIRTFFTGQYGL